MTTSKTSRSTWLPAGGTLNMLLRADTQQQVAAPRHMLRAGQRQRYPA